MVGFITWPLQQSWGTAGLSQEQTRDGAVTLEAVIWLCAP